MAKFTKNNAHLEASGSGFRSLAIRDTTRVVLRPRASTVIFGLLVSACGPDAPVCTGPHPDFVVLLELTDRAFPADTVVHVTYGGSGQEDYVLASPNGDHEVVFCRPASLDGGAPSDAVSDGAAGAGNLGEPAVEALSCELWTGGFATLEVRATGLATVSYNLFPHEHRCTVRPTLVVDSPDAG